MRLWRIACVDYVGGENVDSGWSLEGRREKSNQNLCMRKERHGTHGDSQNLAHAARSLSSTSKESERQAQVSHLLK